jgi:hypothetical protein
LPARRQHIVGLTIEQVLAREHFDSLGKIVGGAPNLSRNLTARVSVNSAVLLSRSTVNCATPIPRRRTIPGIGSRPPWGAERMTGKVPAHKTNNLSPSRLFCAMA